MFRGRDVVCISSIDWDFIWQGHQQIMSTLATHGNRVLFIENTGVRSPRLSDLGRLWHRIARWWKSTQGFREERENLFVFSPLIVPLPYSRIAGWINRAILVGAIRRWMRVVGFGRPIVWTFLPTPLARDLLQAFAPELSIYYCIDDLTSSSAQARRLGPSERKLFGEVDLVFVTSEKLRGKAEQFASRVHLFPFGVDYAPFEAVREDGDLLPPDLAALPRPLIGYLGGIHQWIDQPLVAEVARRMPEATFALVGPLQTDVRTLSACPNVRLLGARSHADVPRYLKGFDVAMVPYRLTDYTAHVYPTKLNEYLAMGLPIVATGLPEIQRFNRDHGDIIRVGSDADAFVDGIRAALEKASPAQVSRRIEVARQNSWEARIARMSGLIEERLAERRETEDRWQQKLRQMYGRTRARLGRIAAVGLLAYAVLFWSPLPWIAAEPLRIAEAPGGADAIVVFAGGVGETARGGEGFQDRVKQAVALYRAGRARHLIFSTGWTYTFQEGELMKALAISLDVPGDAIIIENQAGSTFENVEFVRPILESYGWKKILLVSAPYHMRRATLTFRKLAPAIEVVPAPGESRFYGHGWAGANLSQLRAIAHEYVAILYYRLKGWI